MCLQKEDNLDILTKVKVTDLRIKIQELLGESDNIILENEQANVALWCSLSKELAIRLESVVEFIISKDDGGVPTGDIDKNFEQWWSSIGGKDKYGYLLEKESAKEGFNAAIAVNNI